MQFPFFYSASFDTSLSGEQVKELLYKNRLIKKSMISRIKNIMIRNKNTFSQTENYESNKTETSNFKIKICQPDWVSPGGTRIRVRYILLFSQMEGNNLVTVRCRPILITLAVIYGCMLLLLYTYIKYNILAVLEKRFHALVIIPEILGLGWIYYLLWAAYKYTFRAQVDKMLLFIKELIE